jgi:hypothetical protein
MKIKKFNESKEELLPVLKEDDSTYYVDESDMIKFIEKNSNMSWDYICDFIRKNGIAGSEGKSYWIKSDLIVQSKAKYYNPEAVKWVLKFFEAHPWIERMMLCFDD